jgi:hypothetical protein
MLTQQQQQLRQMQAQQLQLQTEVADLNGQVSVLKAQIPRTPSWTEKYLSGTASIFAVVVSIIALCLSRLYFVRTRDLNQQIAERTVTIEAQKLLLEINKQYLSEPALFAIYDDVAVTAQLGAPDKKLEQRIRALGYMKLNIFELVYDVLPDAGPWKAYFEDSLTRCKVLRDELNAELLTGLYNEKLVRAYRDWLAKKERNTTQTPAATAQQTTTGH